MNSCLYSTSNEMKEYILILTFCLYGVISLRGATEVKNETIIETWEQIGSTAECCSNSTTKAKKIGFLLSNQDFIRSQE